jgi:hypothetical protein
MYDGKREKLNSTRPAGHAVPTGVQLVTNSVEESSTCRGEYSAVSQEIPRILWNTRVRYRVHKSKTLVPTLN